MIIYNGIPCNCYSCGQCLTTQRIHSQIRARSAITRTLGYAFYVYVVRHICCSVPRPRVAGGVNDYVINKVGVCVCVFKIHIYDLYDGED